MCRWNLWNVLLLLTIVITYTSSTKPKIACFYNNFSFTRKGIGLFNSDHLPVKLCTHILYSSIGINTDNWILRIKSVASDIDATGFENFTEFRQHNPDTKMIIVLREESKEFSQMASVKSRRDTLIASVIEFINYYSFDGVSLHWEFPGSSYDGNVGGANDKNNFLFFIEELKRAFNKENKNWSISVLAPLLNTFINEGFHIAEMCEIVDAVHVKGYDTRQLSGYTNSLSPLYKSERGKGKKNEDEININDGLRYWEQKGCPPYKIILGISFFGRTYVLENTSKYELGDNADKKGISGQYSAINGVLSYYEICTFFKDEGWTRKWDDKGKVPFAYKDNTWITYDDTESLAQKIEFIKSKGYLGVYIYSLDFDDFRGLCGIIYPLLKEINEQFKYYEVPKVEFVTSPRPPWLRAPSTQPTPQ